MNKMAKRLFAAVLACAFALSTLAFAGCAPQEPQDELADRLKQSLATYLSSDDFADYAKNVATTEERMPMLYLGYVDGCFYDLGCATVFKKQLNYLGEFVVDGKISNAAFWDSSAGKEGWYGVSDYLFSWSQTYNQYKLWCSHNDVADNSFDKFVPLIKDYVAAADEYLKNADGKTIEIDGKAVQYVDVFAAPFGLNNNDVFSVLQRDFTSLSVATFEKHPVAWYEDLLAQLKTVTGTDEGHAEFIAAYKQAEKFSATYTASNLLRYGNDTLLPLWKKMFTVTQVAFSFGITDVLPMIAANLGFKGATPFCDEFNLSYYDEQDGEFFKTSKISPNWCGFSGRPLVCSLYRASEQYSEQYEKTMQGYFPFEDGWDQPLDEMVNLDRLCDWDIKRTTLPDSWSEVVPQYALATAMMHGIDVRNYKKVVPAENETGEETFDLIENWASNLEKDEKGNYVINSLEDMTVAIAYIAQIYGVQAPTPLGVFSADRAVISLD